MKWLQFRTTWPHRAGAASPVVVVLLAGILVMLIVLAYIMATRPGATATANRSGATAPSDRGVVRAEPSRPVDTTRVKQTYLPGRSYRSVVKASLSGRASHKDWGIVNEMNMHYASEAEIIRTIQSNDGTTLVLVQEFRRMRMLSAFTKLEGLRIDLGLGAQLALDFVAGLLGAPPGWATLEINKANQLLDNTLVRSFIDSLRSDPAAQVKAFFDGLEGKKVRITYVNGFGVKEVEPLGCTLSDDQRSFIEGTSVISDAYVFPEVESRVGQRWTINGQDLQQIVDPTLRARLSGSLTAERGPDGGSPDSPTAQIFLRGGVLDLHNIGKGTETMARWAPRGTMVYGFKDGIITQAELAGSFRIDRRSTDHILFEARFSTEPQYRITYYCEVMK